MQVEVKVVFSLNSMVGSRFISWLTRHQNIAYPHKETPSHVAILVNDRWLFESTLNRGVHVVSIEKWGRLNRIVDTYRIGSMEYSVLADIVRSIKNRRYDYLGAVFLGICILLNKLLGIRLPRNNWLESSRAYFCTEILEMLIGRDLSMMSPADIMSRGPDFVEVPADTRSSLEQEEKKEE